VLKVGDEGRRISVGRKQLEAEPWSAIDGKYQIGERITGRVTRIKDYGAFVEIVPGVEGLIHVSEMSWARRVRHPKDIVDVGDTVDAVILDLKLESRRIGLGLKQALGDPWDRLEQDSPVGSVVSGEVKKTTNFGAFVEVAEGVEGLLHVSDITADRRLNHTNEVLKVGDTVRVKVLEINRERRRLKLGMKQLEPTEIDRYIENVKAGDTVSGRIVRLHADHADVELDEGVQARCSLDSPLADSPSGENGDSGEDGVSSLSAKLEQAWKGGGAGTGKSPLQEGELRSFQVVSLDAESGKIELSLA
jgi:small subunit ribosomal protein S1